MKRAATRGVAALWLLFVPLTIWAAHFLAAYAVAAVYCARSSDVLAAIVAIRWIVAGVTFLALAAIGACAWYGRRITRGPDFRKTRSDPGAGDGSAGAHPAGDPRHGPERNSSIARQTGADQARFVGTVLLLMCALAALAVVYVGSVVLFFGDCR